MVASDPAEAFPIGRVVRVALARSFNTLGRQILSVAVGWELYDRTGSPLTLGLVGLVQVIPVVALFVPAGAAVDRYPRRSIAVVAAAIAALVGVGLALASWLDAPVETYYLLLLLLGCATALHSPAGGALAATIVPRAHLARSNAVQSSLQQTAAIVGPGLAGVLLWILDPMWVYAVVGVTGLTSVTLYRTLPAPIRTLPGAGTASVRRDWRIGLRFIFRSPVLLPALTLDLFAVLFAGATALLPVIAKDVLEVGPAGLGALRAAPSVGAVMMALIQTRLGGWRRPGRTLLIVVALYGVATMGFGLTRSFEVSLILLAVGGALDTISAVLRMTLEQIVVPDRIRGRVSAVHFVFIGMSNELGELESGVAAQLIGAVPAIVGGGAVAIAMVGIVLAKWPGFAAMPPLDQLAPPEDVDPT